MAVNVLSYTSIACPVLITINNYFPIVITSNYLPLHQTRTLFSVIYRGADKSLAQPGRKQVTATEDFDFHISYLLSYLEEY